MNKKEQPVHGGIRERAARTETAAGTVISMTDFTTADSARQGICKYLPIGAEHAVTAEELAHMVGLPSARAATKAIREARLRGIPICASCDATHPGFYLPATIGELTVYHKALARRVRNVTATLTATTAAIDRWRGQTTLDLEG